MTYNLANTAAANIRAVMAHRGLTIASLAEVLGVTPRTARLKYDGKSEFELSELDLLSKWLDMSASELTSPRLILVAAA